jgi:hypothetical protein
LKVHATRDEARIDLAQWRDMASRLVRAGVILATLVASAFCSSTPTEPPNPSEPFAGVWSGPITDEESASGTLRFALEAGQAGSVHGTWTATFSNSSNNNGGTVTSVVALPPPFQFGGECTQAGRGVVIFSMTMTSNRTMSGNYGGVTCNGLRRGTVGLTKQ